jgi:hypothetical protein
VLAFRAMGAGQHQVIHRHFFGWRQLQQFPGLCSPVLLEHFGQAPYQDIDKAARQQAEDQGADDKSVWMAVKKLNHAQITWPNLKIGKYMAITSPPTMTPSTTMIAGSINAVRLSTRVSTSFS